MIKLDLDGFGVENINADNLERYEDVFYCNEEYYMITDGRSATREDCIDTIEYSIDDLPKDCIHNIGFSHEGMAAACLFLIEGYPERDILWIGLFLVHERFKRRSLGTRCIKALIDSLKASDISSIRLSVQDNNLSGLAFWRHMGFTVIDSIDCGGFSNLTMEYVLK